MKDELFNSETSHAVDNSRSRATGVPIHKWVSLAWHCKTYSLWLDGKWKKKQFNLSASWNWTSAWKYFCLQSYGTKAQMGRKQTSSGWRRHVSTLMSCCRSIRSLLSCIMGLCILPAGKLMGDTPSSWFHKVNMNVVHTKTLKWTGGNTHRQEMIWQLNEQSGGFLATQSICNDHLASPSSATVQTAPTNPLLPFGCKALHLISVFKQILRKVFKCHWSTKCNRLWVVVIRLPLFTTT